jgi:hypothetical protein
MPGCGRFSAAGRGTSRASKRDMRSYQIRLAVSLVVFIAAAAVLAPSAATQSNQPAERFTAFAVSTGGARGGAVASTVQITIDRWSTDADRQRLIDTLQSKGPEALLDTLRDTRQPGLSAALRAPAAARGRRSPDRHRDGPAYQLLGGGQSSAHHRLPVHADPAADQA